MNIASLVIHIEELNILTLKLQFDILCINETRLDESINDSQVKLPGYEIIRRDRNRMGGGVASYIRSCIPYIIRTDLNTDNAEAFCLEIRKSKVKPLLVSTWYRPPNANCDFSPILKIS